LLSVACSSVSSTATLSPEATATVARLRVVVVLDVPPLPDATTSHFADEDLRSGLPTELAAGRVVCIELPGLMLPGFLRVAVRDKHTSCVAFVTV